MSAVSLDEIKTHLNITTNASDVELQDMLDAAESIIGQRIGPLEPTQYTDRVVSDGRSIVLPHVPVISLLTVAGVSVASADVGNLHLQGDAGVATWADARSAFTYAGTYDVTYQAGWSTLPAAVVLAVKEQVRHLWETQRGGSRRPGSASTEQTGAGYLMPNRVSELIDPFTNKFGFA